MPCRCKSAAGPMPESCKICGEPMLPALRMTSPVAEALTISPPTHTCTPLQLKLPHLRRGPEFKIGPIHAGGTQKSLRRAPAPALFLIDLKITDALVGAGVEVVGRRNAGLLRGL